MMKLKDWVTLGNLASGTASIVALMNDRFDLACYLIFLGFFFDMFDGIVARITKQFDKFGAELDGLCDLITYSVAPGFIVYYAFYKEAGIHVIPSAILGFVFIAVGVVRAARYNVRKLEFPGFFIGLPRPAAALMIISVLNSALFTQLGPKLNKYLFSIPAVMIVMISVLMLMTTPFIGHHDRKFSGWLRFGKDVFLVSVPASLVAGWLIGYPYLLFDVTLFSMIVYVVLGNLKVPKEELVAVREFIVEWKKKTD